MLHKLVNRLLRLDYFCYSCEDIFQLQPFNFLPNIEYDLLEISTSIDNHKNVDKAIIVFLTDVQLLVKPFICFLWKRKYICEAEFNSWLE